MSPQRLGSTRPSRRQVMKSWVIGTAAVGVIAAFTSHAMGYLALAQRNVGLVGEGQSEPQPQATLPEIWGTGAPAAAPSAPLPAGQCLWLDHRALEKIRLAGERAGGEPVEVQLPASAILSCPPGCPPAVAPSQAPTGCLPAPTGPAGRPELTQPPPASVVPPSDPPRNPPQAPAPPVTSTAS
jgi:hypothetical protein